MQALPKDAQPITLWDDPDAAWLDAVNGIRRLIASMPKRAAPQALTKLPCERLRVRESQLSWANDTEVILTHRTVDRVSLSDIYVPLDIEVEAAARNKESVITIEQSDTLVLRSDRYLVFGEEQQGKTALLKQSYLALLKSNKLPIFLDATAVKTSDIESLLARAISEQYELDPGIEPDFDSVCILIDNLDQIGLNSKYTPEFLKRLNAKSGHVIATCSAPFAFVASDLPELDDYQRCDLKGVGHAKRAELIERWVSLGIAESIGDDELYSRCDDLKSRLDSVIRKNIVPPKPIYILMMLQMFEAYTQQNLELSSYGHCYQQLIYQAFSKAGIRREEIDRYLNVLTELAWKLHTNGGSLSLGEVDAFFTTYAKTYLGVDGNKTISKLVSASIVAIDGGRARFKYPYLLYFFVAKKIAESYAASSESQTEARRLIDQLHREDAANILIFITHHTRDAWVLAEIQRALAELFVDHKPATLSKDQLGFMDDFIASIPELVLEQREIREERRKHEELLDQREADPEPEMDDRIELLASINKAFKGMELAGQIIRNRHATLTRTEIDGLARDGINTGLRFLDYFIEISDLAKAEVIKFVEAKLRDNPSLANEEVQQCATDVFLHMTFGVINAVLRKIASSVGSREASEIYQEIERNHQTPALSLIAIAIELHFKRELNVASVERTVGKVKGNAVCLRLLKEMVVQHTYMFPVDYREKQQLASLLGLSIHGQRLMDRRLLGKG